MSGLFSSNFQIKKWIIFKTSLLLNPAYFEGFRECVTKHKNSKDYEIFTSSAPQKRLTCELGSASVGGNTLGTTACLAHCAYLGHLGGWCDSQNVCHCRH